MTTRYSGESCGWHGEQPVRLEEDGLGESLWVTWLSPKCWAAAG
jgi:hypothetical protein